MPYVHIRVGGSLTKDQRRQIAHDVSHSLEKVAGKPKNATYVVFEEVPRDRWAIGDRLLDEIKPE